MPSLPYLKWRYVERANTTTPNLGVSLPVLSFTEHICCYETLHSSPTPQLTFTLHSVHEAYGNWYWQNFCASRPLGQAETGKEEQLRGKAQGLVDQYGGGTQYRGLRDTAR